MITFSPLNLFRWPFMMVVHGVDFCTLTFAHAYVHNELVSHQHHHHHHHQEQHQEHQHQQHRQHQHRHHRHHHHQHKHHCKYDWFAHEDEEDGEEERTEIEEEGKLNANEEGKQVALVLSDPIDCNYRELMRPRLRVYEALLFKEGQLGHLHHHHHHHHHHHNRNHHNHNHHHHHDHHHCSRRDSSSKTRGQVSVEVGKLKGRMTLRVAYTVVEIFFLSYCIIKYYAYIFLPREMVERVAYRYYPLFENVWTLWLDEKVVVGILAECVASLTIRVFALVRPTLPSDLSHRRSLWRCKYGPKILHRASYCWDVKATTRQLAPPLTYRPTGGYSVSLFEHHPVHNNNQRNNKAEDNDPFVDDYDDDDNDGDDDYGLGECQFDRRLHCHVPIMLMYTRFIKNYLITWRRWIKLVVLDKIDEYKSHYLDSIMFRRDLDEDLLRSDGGLQVANYKWLCQQQLQEFRYFECGPSKFHNNRTITRINEDHYEHEHDQSKDNGNVDCLRWPSNRDASSARIYHQKYQEEKRQERQDLKNRKKNKEKFAISSLSSSLGSYWKLRIKEAAYLDPEISMGWRYDGLTINHDRFLQFTQFMANCIIFCLTTFLLVIIFYGFIKRYIEDPSIYYRSRHTHVSVSLKRGTGMSTISVGSNNSSPLSVSATTKTNAKTSDDYILSLCCLMWVMFEVTCTVILAILDAFNTNHFGTCAFMLASRISSIRRSLALTDQLAGRLFTNSRARNGAVNHRQSSCTTNLLQVAPNMANKYDRVFSMKLMNLHQMRLNYFHSFIHLHHHHYHNHNLRHNHFYECAPIAKSSSQEQVAEAQQNQAQQINRAYRRSSLMVPYVRRINPVQIAGSRSFLDVAGYHHRQLYVSSNVSSPSPSSSSSSALSSVVPMILGPKQTPTPTPASVRDFSVVHFSEQQRKKLAIRLRCQIQMIICTRNELIALKHHFTRYLNIGILRKTVIITWFSAVYWQLGHQMSLSDRMAIFIIIYGVLNEILCFLGTAAFVSFQNAALRKATYNTIKWCRVGRLSVKLLRSVMLISDQLGLVTENTFLLANAFPLTVTSTPSIILWIASGMFIMIKFI